MEAHQTEFLQAVVLAGVVALTMTAWDDGHGIEKSDRSAKVELRKDQVRDRSAQAPRGR
jgi:hypothetical protein